MSEKEKKWIRISGPAVAIFIIIAFAVFNSGKDASGTKNVTPRNTEKRIAAAKAELDKIKAERGKDGQPGKLTLLDTLKPEVVLPPVLALLEDELDYFQINRTELVEQIRTDPGKFRIAVPEHWRKRFLILTPAHEKLIGDKMDAEFASEGKIYQNDKDMKRVRQIADKIVAQLPVPAPVRLFLYRDDTINAFCLPNGSIYIHSGLLKNITDDDELAFVIAHEYAHYAARHGNESVTKFIFLLAGDVLAENKAEKLKKEGKAGKGELLRGSYLGGGIVGALLPFSRLRETEADTLGIRYMARAGYDPQGAIRFTRKMVSRKPDDPLWLKLLSTHPAGPKRLKRLQEEYRAIKTGIPRKRFFRRLLENPDAAEEPEKHPNG
jgi:Zn-dependent protease with chaperone function